MRKKYFLFYHLTNVLECAILYALTPKAVPVLSPAKKVAVSFEAVAFFVVPKKSFNYISFSSFVNRSFQKNIFILQLDKAWKLLYNICGLFLPGLFVSLTDGR